MGTKRDGKRNAALEFYMENQDATQKEIAELFKVSEKTIGDWVKKYNWSDKRLDYNASPVKIKQELQRETLSVIQGNPPKFSADTIAKLMKGIDRCEEKASPIVVQRILKDLDNFVSEIDPEFAAKCTPFHKQFLIHRINLEA